MKDTLRSGEFATLLADPVQLDRIWTTDFVKICVANFSSFGSFYLLLATLPLYIVTIGGGEAEVGLVMGVFALSSVVARPLTGAALDRFGRKSVLIVTMIGMVIASVSYLAAASVLTLLLIRAWHGVSFGGTTTTTMAYVADIVPHRQRAEGVGYFGMFTNISLAIGPWIALETVRVAGFPAMFAVSAAIAAAGVIVSLTLRELPRSEPSNPTKSWYRRLINTKSLRPSLILLFFAATYSAQVAFLPIYAASQNLGNVGVYFIVYAVALILSRIVSGRIADRFGRGVAVIPGLVLAAISMITLSLATDMVLLIVTAVLYGAAFALVTPALMALVVDVTTPANRGSAVATYSAAMDVGIGGGALLWGVVIQQFGYIPMYQAAAVVPVIGIVAYFLVVRGKMRPIDVTNLTNASALER